MPEKIGHHAVITNLSHDGRGIAQIEGKTTFIAHALPGEEVTFRYLKRRGKFDEGIVEEVITPANNRVEPVCQYFGICGGCSLQHLHTDSQIEFKEKVLLEQLQYSAKLIPNNVLSPITSGGTGYRQKARLGVRYVRKKESVLVGFREKNSRYLMLMDNCEVLHPAVGHKIHQLRELIADLEIFEQIPQIEVAIGDEQTALIIRHLSDINAGDLGKLIHFAQLHDIQMYLQPGKANSVHKIWPEDGIERLQYNLPEFAIRYQFHPTDFTQVNAKVNAKMVSQLIDLLEINNDDSVLDLFSGIGNFTLPLATKAKHVVGIEGDVIMTERATENAKLNDISNAEFFTTNLFEDISERPWAKQQYDKILLDPPRAGALELMSFLPHLGAKMICYVSCNPATLARDAALLVQYGYQLTHAGVMDMFPHTSHIESMTIFESTDGKNKRR